ncbi:universal stress protein [Enterococcus dongliensis]|jgi:nucleotide-binding universal stress UspA family protein|nr:universal stress protein [Enterococcus dongliensis]
MMDLKEKEMLQLLAQYKTIMAVVDESEQSKRIVREAVLIAESNNSNLIILSFIDLTKLHYATLMASHNAVEILNEVEVRLKELICNNENMQMRKEVLVGSSKRDIVNFANENSVDLLVMRVEKRWTVKSSLIGLSESYVSKNSNCNILVIK